MHTLPAHTHLDRTTLAHTAHTAAIANIHEHFATNPHTATTDDTHAAYHNLTTHLATQQRAGRRELHVRHLVHSYDAACRELHTLTHTHVELTDCIQVMADYTARDTTAITTHIIAIIDRSDTPLIHHDGRDYVPGSIAKTLPDIL